MAPFAKLFDVPTIGQVLVKLDRGAQPDAAPEVRVYVQPPGLGVCSTAFCFHDTDAGWDAAEAAFEKMDEETATDVAQDLFAKMSALIG